MIDSGIYVPFQYFNDLYFRVKNGKLEHDVYMINYMEWVKAGVAFNTQGVKNATRNISYFAELYNKLCVEYDESFIYDFQLSLVKFYQDLYELYQQHFAAQTRLISKRSSEDLILIKNLFLLPNFEGASSITEHLHKKVIVLADYESTYLKDFQRELSTVYISEDSLLFKMASIMFDYGVKNLEPGVILEVFL